MAYVIWACHIRHVGCPGTHWDVTRQPVKTRPKAHYQDMSYDRNTVEVNFPSLAKEQKMSKPPKIGHMVNTPPIVKTKIVLKMVWVVDQ